MLSHEIYYSLSVCYELSRLVDNMQIVTNDFIVILSVFYGMYFDILLRYVLARMYPM